MLPPESGEFPDLDQQGKKGEEKEGVEDQGEKLAVEGDLLKAQLIERLFRF